MMADREGLAPATWSRQFVGSEVEGVQICLRQIVSARHVATADGLRMVATGSSEDEAVALLDAFVATFRELRTEAIDAQRSTIDDVLDGAPDAGRTERFFGGRS